MRYFVELSYCGAAYNGWQRQPGAPSVQQTIEQAFATVLRTAVEVVGAGRTDTGVHASRYVAHVDIAAAVATEELCRRLNAVLPGDVAVGGMTPVPDTAHARFSAVRREYKYYVSTVKDPFARGLAWQYYAPLDTGAMNEAAAMLTSIDDFTSFAKLHSSNRTNICRVDHARWEREGRTLVFTIRADRFLRNMVRAITGTLVDVGRGRLTVPDFGRIAAARDLSLCGQTAPAGGLYMSNVEYPPEIYTLRQ